MHWHHESCRRLDLAIICGAKSCLSCGSIESVPEGPSFPAIRPSSEIRLLELAQGDFDDPLHCKLHVEHLLSRPVYDAVSYTWADDSGSAEKVKTILVDDKPFQITTNCDYALRRVRNTSAERLLWIDAVCIDQEDVEERGHQVQLMPDIYSIAKSVLVYIGEATQGSRKLLQSFIDAEPIDSSWARAEWRQIVSRRYFNRVWVLQEVALARNLLLICGDVSISW
jgi:hypothetical protein